MFWFILTALVAYTLGIISQTFFMKYVYKDCISLDKKMLKDGDFLLFLKGDIYIVDDEDNEDDEMCEDNDDTIHINFESTAEEY